MPCGTTSRFAGARRVCRRDGDLDLHGVDADAALRLLLWRQHGLLADAGQHLNALAAAHLVAQHADGAADLHMPVQERPLLQLPHRMQRRLLVRLERQRQPGRLWVERAAAVERALHHLQLLLVLHQTRHHGRLFHHEEG